MKTGIAKFHKIPAMLLNFEAGNATKEYDKVTDQGMLKCDLIYTLFIHRTYIQMYVYGLLDVMEYVKNSMDIEDKPLPKSKYRFHSMPNCTCTL